jgi:hypothetical protein
MNKKNIPIVSFFVLPMFLSAMDIEEMAASLSTCPCIAKYTGKPSEDSSDLKNQCIQERMKQYAKSCEFEEGYALECDFRAGSYDKSFCRNFGGCAAKLKSGNSHGCVVDTSAMQKQVEKETAILAAIASKDLQRLNKFLVPFENAQSKLQDTTQQ